MKKFFSLLLIFILSVIEVDAQSMGRSYQTALGVKVYDGAGISFKTFIAPNNALEFVSYFNRYGTRLTGLYEIHGNIAGAAGLRWYVGPGAHITIYNRKNYSYGTVAGLDGVLGLDYKINNAPLNLSIDWQPSFEFAGGRGFVGNWGGIGIRYTF
jgi:hypothetical protein